MSDEKKLTKEEIAKEKSNFLRGTIKEELKNNSVKFEDEASKLLKFHGIYQQDDRDLRQKLTQENKEKAYSLMIRTKLPGGKLTSKQYLSLNEISDKYTNKTLRITTRQTIQFHGVLKKDIHATMNKINKELMTTYGGCGDVVRNVMSSPVCDIDPKYSINLTEYAEQISNYFLPESKAYYEIWVQDEDGNEERKILSNEKEPIYGKTYLPRKFKIGIAVPEDNCVDIFTQDLGLVAIVKNNILQGFNVLVGGGLGHSHNKPETYPRLSSELGFINPEKLIKTCEAIVTVQRDFGGRENRKHARMKYLIDDNGLEWFKKEVEKRAGFTIGSPEKIQSYKMMDHLGWNKQKNGKWYLGIFIENGRIADTEKRKIKTGLKEIIEKFQPEIRLSPQQNIILINIDEKNKSGIDSILEKYNFYILNNNLSTLRRNSLACVSLPTCGLALAEAERALPDIINELEKMNYGNEDITIRMSGCPNSCSRAPNSEIGIIGTSANKYNLYIAGDYNGIRLNKKIKENVSSENLPKEIAMALKKYHSEKNAGERFGDFCLRKELNVFS